MKVLIWLALSSSLFALAYASDEDWASDSDGGQAMGRPSVFAKSGRPCLSNSIVASWCDAEALGSPNVECVIFPDFDAYGCSCIGEAALCPTECIGGKEPEQKTHYGISCLGIPEDEPNYVLKETHALNRCESNAVVSSWCDDFVNEHLECHINQKMDEYTCHCPGQAAACPDDCVGGHDPLEKTHSMVRCKGIPLDQPNYILKEN